MSGNLEIDVTTYGVHKKVDKDYSGAYKWVYRHHKNNYDNVFSSVYAGNIDYYAALLKSDHVVLDVHEFYVSKLHH